jgi:hypothetical protein
VHSLRHVLFAAAFLGASLPVASASAFCRSTTCTGTCARDDDGCKTTGAKLFWPGGCVGFSIQQDGSANLSIAAIRPVIKASFVTWTDLTCPDGTATLSFSQLADVACRHSEYNAGGPNANVIMFQDTSWNYHSADNTLAKTTVSFDTKTGEIFDADIEVNFAYNEITVGDTHIAYDLQSILTHEIGHFVGFDHSPFADATMFASYDPGTTELRTLADDDIAAACTVYAPTRAVTCDTTPKNGFVSACQSDLPDTKESGGCAVTPGITSDRGSALGLGSLMLIGSLALFLVRRRR